jgi:putative Ca2+/H+ antiporter (TMEM165/GDT1 family)
MDAFYNSFLLVFISEMGDKTQLLALVLTARYRKPGAILLGIFIATCANHALASWVGKWISSFLAPQTMAWILAATFFIFAAWILVPDKEGELSASPKFGVLLTTIVAFFLAEMGDKTQLATVALGAKYESLVMVTLGTTFGMMASNGLAVFLGERFLAKVPMKLVRYFASFIFLIFGLAILFGY